MPRAIRLLLILCLLAPSSLWAGGTAKTIERVTTAVPFPRGLVMMDGDLYVLARGRVRGAGGVSAEVNDQAGTIFRVDPEVSEPYSDGYVGEKIRNNGEIFARPTDPPFKLWDRTSSPPESDTRTDRPYCTLRFHEPTQSFYLCAFSGVDLEKKSPTDPAFSKNFTDGLLRYDLRTERWHNVERHNPEAGAEYPHHDPVKNPPPHGWLKGADNCLALGRWLYAAAKDNSALVRYDLKPLAKNPYAGPPPSEHVMGATVNVEGLGPQVYEGQSALAYHDGWLYIAYRTTSEIIRIRLDEGYSPVRPIEAQLLARFDPWNRETGHSADLTDMDIDSEGRVYVVSAKPSRVYRFQPDPESVFDARNGQEEPWADAAALTNNSSMKSENILVHGDWLYITSGDGYSWQEGASGTVYRVPIRD